MEKINIAELLKDCPKGMELDCLLCNNPIVFEGVGDKACFPIRAVGKDGFHHLFTEYGELYDNDDAKCVIFPKGKTTWEGFVPPCKFKDGDIVTWKDEGSLVACVYKERKMTSSFYYHIALYKCGIGIIVNGEIALMDNQLRLSTEEEKQKLFDAIKANGYKWNAETKTLQPYKENTMKEKLEQITFDIPNGYEFFGINDDNQVVLAKKQPIYPKTYEECCKVLGLNPTNGLLHDDNRVILAYKIRKIAYLQELLICRDAYWKIAGDWKPNLGEDFIYSIGTCYGTIEKRMVAGSSGLLLFPTEEMRDAFYENFKELIEECKEFL